MKSVFSVTKIWKITLKALWNSQGHLYRAVWILGAILSWASVIYLWSTSIWLALGAGWAVNLAVGYLTARIMNQDAYAKTLENDLSEMTFGEICVSIPDESHKIGFKL